MSSRNVKAFFVLYGEGKQEDFKDKLVVETIFMTNIAEKIPDEEMKGTLEDVFLSDVNFKILDYNNETGILKMGIEPSLPIWIFENFASYFIPVFEN